MMGSKPIIIAASDSLTTIRAMPMTAPSPLVGEGM